MGQFFIRRSRKFVNWDRPVFLNRYFFICSTYTSNKCFFIIMQSTFPVHVDTMRLIMTQNLSPRTEKRPEANDFPSPPPSLSFEPVSISLRYIMDSFQTSACLFIQDGAVCARSSRQNTGNPGSVIVPQYGSSKITVFVWGKNTILKLLNTK